VTRAIVPTPNDRSWVIRPSRSDDADKERYQIGTGNQDDSGPDSVSACAMVGTS
jgi:hypothetical protein